MTAGHLPVTETTATAVPLPVGRGPLAMTAVPGPAPSSELAQEIKEHTKRVIAPFKAPQEVEFVSELPKTLTGKVLRRQLRARG